MNPLPILFFAAACAQGSQLPTTTIQVKSIPMVVEVADDAGERARGLQHRESLPEDRGMLFVYPAPKPLSFWMEFNISPVKLMPLLKHALEVNHAYAEAGLG